MLIPMKACIGWEEQGYPLIPVQDQSLSPDMQGRGRPFRGALVVRAVFEFPPVFAIRGPDVIVRGCAGPTGCEHAPGTEGKRPIFLPLPRVVESVSLKGAGEGRGEGVSTDSGFRTPDSATI
jgi:hypothetical protein